MKIIKRALKALLNYFNYSVVKNVPPKPIVYNAFFRGGCLKCYKGDPLCEEILLGIGWDEQLKDIISESINKYPQRPCIEIGANIGAGFITLAGNFPNTNFDCFEPVPRFFELLKANKKSYNADNVTLFNQALSDSIDTEIEIAVGLGTAGRPETAGKNEFIKLKTINLDSLYLEKGASLIKLVRQA